MRWLRASAFACAALTALSGGSAWAGVVTVAVLDDGTTSPNGSCTQRPGVSPWQFKVTAGGSTCDFRLRIEAVPGSRAADIVSAHVESRLYGAASGFRFGLLAADGNALTGSVPVANGDRTVSTVDTTTPLKTSSGSVTMVLRSVGERARSGSAHARVVASYCACWTLRHRAYWARPRPYRLPSPWLHRSPWARASLTTGRSPPHRPR